MEDKKEHDVKVKKIMTDCHRRRAIPSTSYQSPRRVDGYSSYGLGRQCNSLIKLCIIQFPHLPVLYFE